MGPRSVLKSLREFAVRELREKRVSRVCVRRVKMKLLMRRGRLPDLRVRAIEGTYYLIGAFHGDSLRLYYFDKRGALLGASEFTGVEKERIWELVSKGTRKVLCAPT